MNLRKTMKSLAVAAVLGFGLSAVATGAQAVVLIDGTTLGLYNAGIGETLNGTNPFSGSFLFPNNNSNPNDPTFNSPPEPDLSAAAASLGNWLTSPDTPGGTWSAAPQAIPSTWTVNSETAIIYEIDAGPGGLTGVTADFGVDNGIFVWLDGVFQGGQLRPGGSVAGELMLSLGILGAGTHYLQILREDHGGGTGYSINVEGQVSAVPLPAALPLFAGGLGLMGLMGWRRKRKAAA